jgi:DNA-binding NarL/FixJ family response regulator
VRARGGARVRGAPSSARIAEALRAAQSGSLLNRNRRLLKNQLQPQVPMRRLRARLEVLRALARGLPNKLIAGKLFISEHTVKFHSFHPRQTGAAQ